MNQEKLEDVLVLMMCVGCALVGFVVGFSIGQHSERKEAIAQNVGHFGINPTNGEKSFIYESSRVLTNAATR